MYPIKFKSIYFEKIWGGRDFEAFRPDLPAGNIGESWDIACHPNGTGIVENGEYKGMPFNALIEKFQDALAGTKVSKVKLPLLVKLINAGEKLSVQVHPGDEYAKVNEGEYGKTEAWYVIDAKPGASLVIGTKNCTREQFREAIKDGTVENYLNKVDVKKGDSFLISSGLVHAIGGGVIIAEIQQNSDITYRVYDYGRPRELHIEKALDVIDFNLQGENLSDNKSVRYKGYTHNVLCTNKYFSIEKFDITDLYNDHSSKERFDILTCVDGKGQIEGDGFSYPITKGDSYFIPSALGSYVIKGNLSILKSFPMV